MMAATQNRNTQAMCVGLLTRRNTNQLMIVITTTKIHNRNKSFSQCVIYRSYKNLAFVPQNFPA